MPSERGSTGGVESTIPEIGQLLDSLPYSVQSESRRILKKIDRLEAPQESDLDLSMLKSYTDTALLRFGLEPQPVLIIIRPIEDLPQKLDYRDANWAVTVANLRLSTIYDSLERFLDDFGKEFNPERRSKTLQVLNSIEYVTRHLNPVFQQIAKDAIGFALVADSQLITDRYPKGNPAEPLLDICTRGAIPLGIDQGRDRSRRFLIATAATRLLIGVD